MASKAQTLTTNIVMNATAKGFTQLGNTITNLGYQVDLLSQRIINFGKESLDIYDVYEKYMTQAKIALSTREEYTKGSRVLQADMELLDEYASRWADTTIYDNEQVAKAIMEATRAGWSYEEIINNMPSVMNLATAGSLELSDTLHTAIQVTRAYGVPLEETAHFMDLWAYSANKSVGSIETFGESMTKMGSTMRFISSPEEMFALLKVMHDMGTEGSQAGTLLRNAILRIIAPTDKARKQLYGMGIDLNLTDEELDDLTENAESYGAALESLHKRGFNAYDEEGKLKPILQIFQELDAVTQEMTEDERNNLLSTVFGVRVTTGALNILNGLDSALEHTMELQQGAAEGYTSWGAALMEGTLWGQLELFESKVEGLKRKTGEAIAGEYEGLLQWLGDLILQVNNMDDGSFQVLVRGMEVIAAAGPGLLMVGGAFKLLGLVLSPAGAVGMGLIAVTAFVAAMKEMENQQFLDKFGDMNFDKEGVKSYVLTIADEFDKAYTKTDSFATALQTATSNFRTASQTFSAGLLETLLKGGTLTEAEKVKLTKLGETMYDEIESAITQRQSKSMAFWEALFSGDENFDPTDPEYKTIVDSTHGAYLEALAQAQLIGQNLRNALTEAFEDGVLTEDEAENIRSFMRDYNRVMAQAAADAQSEEEQVQMETWLLKAQGASFDDTKELAETAMTERDTILKQNEDRFYDEYARLKIQYEKDGEIDQQEQASLDEAQNKYKEYKQQVYAKYDDFLVTLWTQAIETSELSDEMDTLFGWVDELFVPGTETRPEDVGQKIFEEYGTNKNVPGKRGSPSGGVSTDMSRVLGNMIISMGGRSAVEDSINSYTEQGDLEMANRLRRILMAEAIIDEGYIPTSNFFNKGFLGLFAGQDFSLIPYRGDRNALFSRLMYGEQGELQTNAPSFIQGTSINPAYTTSDATTDANEYSNALQTALGENEFDLNIELPDAAADMTEYASEAQGAADSNIVYEDVEMPNGAEMAYGIFSEAQGFANEHPVQFDAHFNMPSSWGITPKQTNGNNLNGYAEGGRATTASIFGDAGAEWAIPEEHSARTAELLNAARAASGFTWPDLIARYGGLNANANHTPATYVYSPTINAQDASGVAAALQEDRRRFERWIDERERREGIEVYA